MTQPVKWGLVLGAAVAIQNLVFGAAGWHRTFNMSFVFLAIAIALNVLAVVLCLRKTAADTRWLGQLRNGLVLGLVASLVIFASSWLVTSVIFPDYFAEMAEGYRDTYAGMGLSQEEVEELVDATAATSSVRSALEGVMGTLVVSSVVAAIAGVWLRRKD